MENKPYNLIISASAEQDLENIWHYGANTWSVTQARNHHFSIMAIFETLKDLPKLGRERPDLKKGLRAIVISPHIILYKISANQIEIVRVLDGRVDLPQVLNS